MEILKNWKRNPNGDRPELEFPCQPREGRLALPQVVGFINEQGTPIELSVEKAQQLGLIGIGEIAISRMTTIEWNALQVRKRIIKEKLLPQR